MPDLSLTPAQRGRLLATLTKLPLFHDKDTRGTLLDNLPANLVSPVSRSDFQPTDSKAIIKAAGSWKPLNSADPPLLVCPKTAITLPEGTARGRKFQPLLREIPPAV